MPSHSTLPRPLEETFDAVRTLKPDAFEIYLHHRQSLDIDVKDQKIDTLSQSEDVGLSIRIVLNQRPGFSFTTSLEPTALKQAVEQAFEIATFMPQDEFVHLRPFDSGQSESSHSVDHRGLELSLHEKTKIAQSLEAQAYASDLRMTAVRSATLSQVFSSTHLLDSKGTHLHHSKTLFTGALTCKAEDRGDQQVGSDFGFSHQLEKLDLSSIAKTAVLQATRLLGASHAPTLKCPALLQNHVVAEILEFLAPHLSMEHIEKRRSLLAGKENQPIFSPRLNLIHDGCLPGGFGTSPFDAEGVPSQKVAIIQQGTLQNILTNPYYARKTKRTALGCSIRSIQTPPSIGYANLYLEEGAESISSLMSQIPLGIWITDVMGIHTANPVTGDFSLGASGILIEKGQPTQAVRGFAIAGNLVSLLQGVTAVGNDLRFFGKIGAPSLQVSEIAMSGV